MKAVIISYGHPCSGLTIAKHLSRKINLTFLLVVCGNHFEQGILNLDLKTLPYGLNTDKEIINRQLPEEVVRYVDSAFDLFILRTPNAKILKDWKRKNIKFCFEAAKYIQQNKFDVVHFNGSSGFQAYFHLFLLNKPKVYTIHDYIGHSGEKKIQLIIMNSVFTRLNYQFIQHSNVLRERFIKYYHVSPERVHSVTNGPLDIYAAFKKQRIEEDGFTVLFWGRIFKYKGIKYLLRAANSVKKELPFFKIIIAGKGNLGFQPSAFDDSIFDIKNDYINNETLVSYIQKSSLIVLPYTDATQSAVLMTAFAFDKPVIATSVGGIPELVENNITGILVPPRDHKKLAAAILDLLKNPAKREAISLNIMQKFSQGSFSWNSITDKIIGVYKKAISAH